MKDFGGSIMGEQSSIFDEYTKGSKFKCSKTNDLDTIYFILQTSVLLAIAFSFGTIPSIGFRH